MGLSDVIVQAVWEKARVMPEWDPGQWRRDQCGAWLHRKQYNNEQSEYGWKILKVVAGGGTEVGRLQAFHYGNSYDIANGRAQCRVTADRTGLAPSQRVDQPRNSAA
ncbi:MAG: hypothetical protein GTO41_26305 [Burkholderiales bacterium]|nr:hypothetical protein [Burkholderiales bacterium]